MASKSLDNLKHKMSEITALNNAAGLLGWDQQTYMPPGGVRGRAEQLATIGKLSHEMFTAGATGDLLSEAEREVSGDIDDDDSAFVREVRRDYDRATKVPSKLVSEFARVTAHAHEVWTQARKESKYDLFAPWLSQILDLTRELTDHIGYAEERYDALLDQYEPGMTAARTRALFARIKPELQTLVRSIAEKGANAVDASCLNGRFDAETQRRFGEKIVTALGFDWKRGRQDKAVHPFCANFSNGDVRITTRFDENFLPMALFGSVHETGHALYEQGVADRYDGNVLGGGVSLGVHESQSRLWENLVARSRPFWQCHYSDLRAAFPDALNSTAPESWYRAINRVWPTMIRVEADEVTYNLHILLRFEMEQDLLNGDLSVADAPAAWNAKMQENLGLTPTNDAEGILQDVHWSGGGIGYFPTYTFGNILSVQFFEQANKDLGGNVREQIAAGDVAQLREWLSKHIYQWGRKFKPAELVRRATGSEMEPTAYLAYLKAKFGEIYGL